MKIILYLVFILCVFAGRGLALFVQTKDERQKSDKNERQTGDRGLMIYHLFFCITTSAALFWVFLILNAVRLFLKTILFFASEGKQEDYLSTVYNSTPLAGWSVLFFILFFLLLTAFLAFSQTKTGRQVVSEARELLDPLLNRFFFLFLMLIQLFPFLAELYYSKPTNAEDQDDEKLQSFRSTTPEMKDYSFRAPLPDTYGVFLRRLARYRTIEEKIGFAYSTVSRLYKRKAEKICVSDTPREMERKAVLSSAVSREEAERVRAIIERVKFQNPDMGEGEKAQLLDKLCLTVKTLL